MRAGSVLRAGCGPMPSRAGFARRVGLSYKLRVNTRALFGVVQPDSGGLFHNGGFVLYFLLSASRRILGSFCIFVQNARRQRLTTQGSARFQCAEHRVAGPGVPAQREFRPG